MGFFNRKQVGKSVTFEAPKVSDDYFRSMLLATGFPPTKHNVQAIHEQVGLMFLTKAHQLVSQIGTPDDVAKFFRRFENPVGSSTDWPQQVLDGMLEFDPNLLQYIHDLPERVERILLEATKPGQFFSGSPSEPLPRLADMRAGWQ